MTDTPPMARNEALADQIDAADFLVIRNCPMVTKFDHENVDTIVSGDDHNSIVSALRARSDDEAVAWCAKNDSGHWYVTEDKAVADFWRNIEKYEVLPVQRSASQGGGAEDKLRLFLSILAASGGETSGNDSKWNWVNYFCDDAEPLDTFNQASKRKLTRVTHDSDTDHSVVYLTDAGRAFLSTSPAPSRPAAQPMREALEECVGIIRQLRLEVPAKAVALLAPASANEVKHD